MTAGSDSESDTHGAIRSPFPIGNLDRIAPESLANRSLNQFSKSLHTIYRK